MHTGKVYCRGWLLAGTSAEQRRSRSCQLPMLILAMATPTVCCIHPGLRVTPSQIRHAHCQNMHPTAQTLPTTTTQLGHLEARTSGSMSFSGLKYTTCTPTAQNPRHDGHAIRTLRSMNQRLHELKGLHLTTCSPIAQTLGMTDMQPGHPRSTHQRLHELDGLVGWGLVLAGRDDDQRRDHGQQAQDESDDADRNLDPLRRLRAVVLPALRGRQHMSTRLASTSNDTFFPDSSNMLMQLGADGGPAQPQPWRPEWSRPPLPYVMQSTSH